MADNFNRNNNRQQTNINLGHAFQLAKLKLSGKAWTKEDPKLRPVLQLVVAKEANPRFRMYMNEGAMGSNSVSVNFDPIHFHVILELILMAAESENIDRNTIGVKARFEDGRQLDQPAVVAKVSVGRDSDGIVYFSVGTKKTKQAIFQMLPNYWFEFLGADNEAMNPAKASTAFARSWAKQMQQIYNTVLGNLKQEDVSEPRNGAARPGGYSNNNQSGGNYQPRQTNYSQNQSSPNDSGSNWTQQATAAPASIDFDEDITF